VPFSNFHALAVASAGVDALSYAGMHLDSDATLSCAHSVEDVDPFEEMAKSDAVYGLFETGVEDPAYTTGWTSFVEEYTLLHDVIPPVPAALFSNELDFYIRQDDEYGQGGSVNVSTDPLALTWGTAWEILDLVFFTSQRVWDFTQKVERSLGHYRFNWGDHLVRAYQVQLFAPLERVRCFDAAELPGVHGCSGYESEYGSESVYRLLQGLACPGLWSSEALWSVPWSANSNSPGACLQRCNELTCHGFDVIFYGDDNTADCFLRTTFASDERCVSGGPAGAAGEAWRRAGGHPERATLIAATNRYTFFEQSRERIMNCSAWRQGLAEKLRKLGGGVT